MTTSDPSDEDATLRALDALIARVPVAEFAAPAVDVEAALARVKARAREEAAAAPAARPRLTIERGGAPRTTPGLTPRLTPVGAPARPAVGGARIRRAVGLLAATGLAAAGLAWWRQHGTTDGAVVRYATTVGHRRDLRLADGTRVVLGPASTLQVAAAYGRPARLVTLTGEAYFQVVHDPAHPFEVRTAVATVRDVGTAFVVRAGDSVDVAVTDGVVQLQPVVSPPTSRTTTTATSPAVTLRAGDRGRVGATRTGTPAAAAVVARGRDVADDTAWTAGRLVFRDAPLGEVAGSLRRWYGVELRFADSAVATRHLTATFTNEPADVVLRVVGLATGARLDRRGDTVLVRSDAARVPQHPTP